MRQYKVNKIILAWLLAAIFITPLIVKSIHIYKYECYEEHCSHANDKHKHKPQHNSNTCQVCKLTLSLFTEASFRISDTIQIIYTSRIYSLYLENGYNSITQLNYLRAPPSIKNIFSSGIILSQLYS